MLFKLSFSNMKKSLKDYAVYFFTLILGVAIFYLFNAIETQTTMLKISEDTREIVKLINTTLSGVSVFVAFILGFLVIYASNFLMKKRKKEFALYILLGMGKRKISLILFLETLIIGVISLGIGLVAGIGLSQVTSIFVANMFGVNIEKYRFVFSQQAFVKTLIYFAIIYVVVILFNMFCINKYKLIDLLTGSRKAEKATNKNPYICAVVWIISVALLAFAYYKVSDSKNLKLVTDLGKYIVMGCAGTFLFFWSLSGMMFSVVHSMKNVYYKGLNSFVFRQMSSRMNSNVFAMTVICLMMFITICVLSSGLTVRNSLVHNIDMLSPADVQIEKELYSDNEAEAAGVAEGVDMTEAAGITEVSDTVGTSDNAGDVSAVANAAGNTTGMDTAAIMDNQKEYVQGESIKDYYKRKDIDLEDILKDIVDVYVYNTSELTINDTLGNTEAAKANNPDIADDIDSSYFDSYYSEDIMKLSDYNKVAALYGNEQYSLNSDEYIIVADFKSMAEVRNKALDKGVKIALNGKLLKPKYNHCSDGFIQMSSNHINIGIVVVPDEVLETMLPTGEYYIGNYKIPQGDEREAVDKKIVKIANGAGKEGIIMDINTLISVKENSMGLGAMIAFIALYIGLIFLISGAAILALKELSESADNLGRYKILKNLGTDNSKINHAVLKQTAIFFGIPMALAIVHSIFGMRVSYMVMELLGTEYMVQSVIMTGVFILLIYGGYFVITYNSCKNMIKNI